jgi:sporulation-control protein spo0M
MGFSDKMRDSLGVEGTRLEVAAPKDPVAPGAIGQAQVTIVGGSKPAHVEALVVRIVEADRHWVDGDGGRVSEADAAELEDRRHLTAAWTRNNTAEYRHDVGVTIEPGQRHEVEVAFEVPSACGATSVARSHTLNVQADIKGQIDPTGNARFIVG